MGKKRAHWHEDALAAVRALRNDGVISHPTDTVWGLAADATSTTGVQRIFDIKQRAISETLLMLIDSEQALEQLLPNLPEAAWELLEVSDRPVTLVGTLGGQVRHTFAPGMVREDGSIAVRLVSDPYLCFLIQESEPPSLPAAPTWPSNPPRKPSRSRPSVTTVDFNAHYRRADLNCQSSMLVHFDDGGRMRFEELTAIRVPLNPCPQKP